MIWLVVSDMLYFSIIYGIILPIYSYFSRWLKHIKTTNQFMIELPLFWPPQLVSRWRICGFARTRRVAVGGSKTFVFLGADLTAKWLEPLEWAI
jgi:hypothetical protein